VITFRRAARGDLPEIEGLLREAGLPTTGVGERVSDFAVAEAAGRVVGCAGLEVYGGAALLRSVAVRPAFRGQGIGRDLVEMLLDRAAAGEVTDVYLLTTAAAGYFRRLGFEPVGRDAVAPAVQASAEFGDACCAAAQAMHLRVAGRPEM